MRLSWVEKLLFFLVCLEVCNPIAPQGRTERLYVWCLSRSKRKRRARLDLCRLSSSTAPAQACAAVGGPLRGDDMPLAASRQKHRWPPWLAVGCGLVRAFGRVDGSEEPPRA